MANTLKDLAASLKLVGQGALAEALTYLKTYIDAQGSGASSAIAAVSARLDALIGAQAGDVDKVLNTFNEIKAFLADYDEDDTLKSIIDAAVAAAKGIYVELLSMNGAVPMQANIGDKVYDPTTHKIRVFSEYQTIGGDWNRQENPVVGTLYTDKLENKVCRWNGSEMVELFADHATAAADHTTAQADHAQAVSDHAAVEVYVDSLGAFDISACHATDGVLAKYANLAAALGTNGANVPEGIRKGGMSVKFVQSNDKNSIHNSIHKRGGH